MDKQSHDNSNLKNPTKFMNKDEKHNNKKNPKNFIGSYNRPNVLEVTMKFDIDFNFSKTIAP